MAESMKSACLSEFVGTFMLVFTIGCNVIAGSAVWGATSIACVLMVCVYALGPVSGGHFNPAVSFGLGLARSLGLKKRDGKNVVEGGCDWKTVFIYMGMQLLGAIVAGFAYSLTLWEVFNLSPQKGFGWWEAAIAEILYTFMLVFVILNVAASREAAENKGEFFGLAIGFVIVAGGYGAGAISGGCFNPAVAIGIDLSSFSLGIGWCIAYTCFELIGAALAVVLFKMVRPSDFDEAAMKQSKAPEATMFSSLISEFLGTFFLVLTVGLNVLGGSQAPVFSIAAALMCMIFALGGVSGAHFNPAVTFAIVCCGSNKKNGPLEYSKAAQYVIAQVVGGICAALTYSLLYHGESFPLAPGKGYGNGEAWLMEMFFTYLLAFVVLSVATVEPSKVLGHFFGLAIGSCVTAGGYAIGAISGGSLNPAVSIAIATSHIGKGGDFAQGFYYSISELCGGALAAMVFHLVRPDEFKKASQLPG